MKASSHTGSGRRLLFFLMCLLGGFAILSSTISKNPVLPLFAESLGVTGADLGFIASASTIPGILVSLPAGSLSDIFGRRKVILASLLIFATAPFLYFLVHTAWQLALVRFYHGFATAIFGPVAQATIAELYPKRKGERMSLFSSSTIVGRSIAPFLGGAIIYTAGLISVYLAAGVSGLAALAIGLLMYRAFRDGGGRSGVFRAVSVLAAWRVIASNVKILATSYVEAVQRFTFGAFEYFLVLYAQMAGLDSLQLGIVSGAQLVTIVVSKPVMGWVSDRVGRRGIISGGLIVAGVPLALTPMAGDFPQFIAVSILYGLGLSMVTSSTAPYIGDLTSRESYGAAMGLLSTIMDVGQTLGPIVTGFIIASFSYKMGFWLLAAILFASSAIFLLATGVRRMRGGENV
ncbi:MFS transporter [Candidatus Bathyarchaeota archaeon]|nr:MAG: MFS transporter [Candidatus Bathyarchaeota archaeon]